MTEEERKMLCEAYEVVKNQPNNEATTDDDEQLSRWSKASQTFISKGYMSSNSVPIPQSGKFVFTNRGIKAARIICGYVEGYTLKRLSVGNPKDGYEDVILTGKSLYNYPDKCSDQDDLERCKDYVLYDTEEGLLIHEDEYLAPRPRHIEEGDPYPDPPQDVRSRLLTFKDARDEASGINEEVLEFFTTLTEWHQE